jgi:hypothetical protein
MIPKDEQARAAKRVRVKRAQRQLLKKIVVEALERWPDNDEPINGGDMVDWFNEEFRPVAEIATKEVNDAKQ